MDPTLKLQILQYLQTIPKGFVMTYKWLGKVFGVHPRAIASVMRYNQDPELYPCYKVIAASGKLSGYNTPAGIPEKIAKLQADGIQILEGKISQTYIYQPTEK